MTLLVGVGLVVLPSLLYAWAYGACRRPVPAAWTRYSWISSGIVIAVVCTLPLGIGFLMLALMYPGETLASLDALSIGGSVGLAFLGVIGVPMLSAPGRVVAAQGARVVQMPPRTPSGRTPGARHGVKRAA
jgi:hypothetical protein